MNRIEYFETEDGQRNLYWKRSLRELHLEVSQEPKTKKSLNREDKRYFRKSIKEQLQKRNRRAYRKDIILEIDYYTTADNPPPLQTLSKNYLDLLHKKRPDLDDLKAILFKDDSQIKILIANYHLNDYQDNKPYIRITTNTLKNFYEDISLADRIIKNDFKDKDYSNNYWYDEHLREERLDDDTDVYHDYYEHIKNKEKIIKTWGEQYFFSYEFMYKREIQERYLHLNRISIQDLINFYQSEFSNNQPYKNDKDFNSIWNATQNYVFLASDYFELGNAPAKEGESTIFKENLRKHLDDFKTHKPVLFPFLVPVSIIVLFTPPIKNILDLDNLARRYIVPFITEILKPPASFSKVSEQYDFLNFKSKGNQKYHPNSLTNYQLLHLPRKSNSPENGEIKFVITNGDAIYKNVKNTTDEIIRKWKD